MTSVPGHPVFESPAESLRPGPELSDIRIVRLLPAPMSELDWLNELLAPLGIPIEPFDAQTSFKPGTIYLYHNVRRMELDPAVLDRIRAASPAGLLHLGDEYLRTDLKLYAAFDFVIRMFPFSGTDNPGVLNIPLGYTSGLNKSLPRLASERKSLWMFAGDWKSDRSVMARAFDRVPGGFLSLTRSMEGERPITRAEYLSQMADAVFAPAPAGNIALETCRAYEALELGAIPILPKRRYADMYRDVLGEHPLPDFTSWTEAADFVRAASSDKAGLNARQAECLAWWAAEKQAVSDRLGAFIRAGFAGQYTDSLAARYTHHGVSRLDRFGTLLAQQNKEQMRARLQFEMRRLFARVRGKPKLEGAWTFQSPEPPPHANDDIHEKEKPGLKPE